MNLDAYKKQLIEFASRPNEKPFDSPASYISFENNVYEFLDENYEIYLKATVDERKEIRKIINDYNRSEKDVPEGGPLPTPLRYTMNGYGPRARKQLEITGDKVWLVRGLVVISILDGIHYQSKDKEHLARIFVTAEKKRLNPMPMFQSISKISNNEPPMSGEISTRELIANIPNMAHEIVDQLKEWGVIEDY